MNGLTAARALRRVIFSGQVQAGDALPSERELAQQFKLARRTVRNVLQALEKEGLVEGGDRRVRRVKSTRRMVLNSTVAVVDRAPIQAMDPAYMQPGWATYVQIAAMSHIQSVGMRPLMVLAPDAQSDQAVQQLLEAPPSGAVLTFDACGAYPQAAQVLEAFLGAGIPVVTHCDNTPEMSRYDRVCTDHRAGGQMLAEYLLGLGRRRILRLYRVPQLWPWLARRDEGFEAAHRQAGLTPLPGVLASHLTPHENSPQAGDFEMIARLLVSYLLEAQRRCGPIDAIVTSMDRHAYEIAAACRMLNLTPGQDVIIVGYDNCWAEAPERLLEKSPPAATVDKHHACIGRALVDMLLARMDGRLDAGPQCQVIRPELKILGC